MKYIVLKVYLKNRRTPVCTIKLESERLLNKLLNDLNEEKKVIRFGQIVFSFSEFKYLTIVYK